jgi:hypothetical protein
MVVLTSSESILRRASVSGDISRKLSDAAMRRKKLHDETLMDDASPETQAFQRGMDLRSFPRVLVPLEFFAHYSGVSFQ